ncbi:MAG TPA: MarR family transcriptional regulator [Candidatus Omnitrophota bacterium]|nr:MarR family transcriptional regulator [Candidatus Omnitrophota bacterium]HQQ05828.1 MarR family transcriptional regulator [Candidatus Omnitrophota bacterium]
MDNPSLTEYSRSLIEIMPEVVRGLWKREINELTNGTITPPQIFILIYLNKMGELRMTDVARYLSVTTAAATGIVDRLVRGGYVSRMYDPSDRRIIRVRLTEKGKDLVKNLIVHKVARIKEIFSRLSDKDRTDYLRVLTRIQGILAQESEAGQ